MGQDTLQERPFRRCQRRSAQRRCVWSGAAARLWRLADVVDGDVDVRCAAAYVSISMNLWTGGRLVDEELTTELVEARREGRADVVLVCHLVNELSCVD